MRFTTSAFGIILLLYVGWHFVAIPQLHHNSVEVIIKKGTTTEKTLDLLKEKNIITSKFLVKLYLKLTNNDKRIKTGRFRVRSGLHDLYAIREFLDAEDLGVKFRVLEGMDLREIASLAKRLIGIDSVEFLNTAKDSGFIRELFRNYFPEVTPPPNRSLEGYLYPDTYYFSEGTSSKRVISTIFARAVKVLRPLLPLIDSSGLTLHEVLTLSSIVEKEAVLERERPIIASVFLNRLRERWPLEACATIQYILPKRKGNLTYEDLRIKSPYNTYIHKGLPPGPIGSPRLSSIMAVLRPANTDYYYFVAKGDNSHYFSKTFEEHVRAKRFYQAGSLGKEGIINTLP